MNKYTHVNIFKPQLIASKIKVFVYVCVCVCVYIYIYIYIIIYTHIHTHTHKQKLLFWMQLIAINRLTAFRYSKVTQKATICSGWLKWDKRPLWDACSCYVSGWTPRVQHQAPEQWEHWTTNSPQTRNLSILHRADAQPFNEISICWNSMQTDSAQRTLASSVTACF